MLSAHKKLNALLSIFYCIFASGGYSSLSHAFRSIQGQDGLSGFYRGWRPAVIQIFPLIGLNFGLYHVVREPMQRVVNNFQVANFLSGALTGLAVKLALHPFDVFKKRLMVSGKINKIPSNYLGQMSLPSPLHEVFSNV